MKKSALRTLPVLLLPLALSGCFSTGSGSSGPSVPEVGGPKPSYQRFTSIPEMKRGATTKVSGIGAEASYTFEEEDEGEILLPMSLAAGSVNKAAVDVDVQVGEDGRIAGATVYGPDTTRTWTVSDEVDLASSENQGFYGDDATLTVQALDQGYDYQTFGVWTTGRNRSEDGATAGAFSVGASTAYADVPVRGSAVFTGSSMGTFVDREDQEYLVTHDVRLEADFQGRTVYYSGDNARRTSMSDGVTVDDELFDMAGSMTYGASNTMSGTVAAKNGMTGTLDGQFYGPRANEIGGTVVMEGSDSQGSELYVGSFGARR